MMAKVRSCGMLLVSLFVGATGLMGRPRTLPKDGGAPAAPLAARALASGRLGALASAELQLLGLSLDLPDRHGDVPSQAPFVVKPVLKLGKREATASERGRFLPGGARLEAILSGPGIPTQTCTGTLETGITFPGLPGVGEYTVTGVKLVHQGKTLMDAGNVSITCLGEVMVSSVTSTAMSMEEMRAAGIAMGPGAFEGKRFTVALVMGSQKVDLTIPIARPIHNGLETVGGEAQMVGRLDLKGEGIGQIPDLSVQVVDMRPDETFALSRPEVQPLLEYGFKSLVVIPGSIKFLKQFFKVHVIVLNTLPDGAPYVVRKLTARAILPPGADGGEGTPDDPLKTVTGEGVTEDLVKAVLGHDASGQPSASEIELKAGQSGSATWLLRGDREGAHLAQFHIQGEFSGGALTGPISIVGRARGKVVVQNPTFHLVLVHPDVVRKNEPYQLEARLTNTSQVPANGVQVGLDMARLSGARLDEGETHSKSVDTLAPGETAVFKFRLRARHSGEVISTYQFFETGLSGGFLLGVGMGERSIRLSSDTLVMPQSLDDLPESFRDALLRVLGQAHSIATSKSALAPGVLPVRGTTVTSELASALTEAGVFMRMGVPRSRVLLDLWRAFTRSTDLGFDHLMRTTQAGQELTAAFIRLLKAEHPDHALGTQIQQMASVIENKDATTLAVVETEGQGLVVGATFADGSQIRPGAPLPVIDGQGVSMGSDGSTWMLQAPGGHGTGRLWARNDGSADVDVRMVTLAQVGTAPVLNRYTVTIPAGATASVELGGGREPRVVVQPGAGKATEVSPAETVDVLPEPFQVLAVHRWDLHLDPTASPYGTHVVVLFNKANKPVALPEGEAGFTAGSAMVSVEANSLWRKRLAEGETEEGKLPPALLQTMPRIVSVYLEKPVGPNILRKLTLLEGWTTSTGEALSGNRVWDIRCGAIPGGAIVRGRARKVTGEPLTGTFKYWYYTDPMEGGRDLFSGDVFETSDTSYYALVSDAVPLGPNGEYQIDFAPEPAKTAIGPLIIEATTPSGSAGGQATVLGPNQIIEMDLVLEGQGDVVGKVTNARGEPLANVEIQATQEMTTPQLQGSTQGMFQASTSTDAAGAYLIKGLKTGVFSVRYRHGLLGAARSSTIARDGDVVRMDVVLDAPTVTITARLLNTDGTPRAGQPLYLGVPTGLLRDGKSVAFIYPLAKLTNQDGRVTFTEVPAGDVSVRGPGLAGGLQPSWFGYLLGGASADVVLTYPERSKVVETIVRVVDSLGQPVPSAKVEWSSAPGKPGSTQYAASNGEVVLPSLAGKTYYPHVTHGDWPPTGYAGPTYTPASGQENLLVIAMPPRSWLYGSVRRPDGTPVVGAYVAIPPVVPTMSQNRLARTDAQGAYRLPGLPTREAARIAIVGPELRTSENRYVQGVSEQGVQLDVVLPHDGRNVLQGHVYQPREGSQKLGTMATVEVYAQLPQVESGGDVDDLATDGDGTEAASGRFGLPKRVLVDTFRSLVDGSYKTTRPLPVGPYEVVAWNDLFPTRVTVKGTFLGGSETVEQDVTLVSTFAGALEGRVYQPDGCTRVGAGVRVTLTGGTLGEGGITVETVANGTYAFPRVIPEGQYTLLAEDPATGARMVDTVRLEKEVNRFRTIRLLGRGNLTVRLVDATGKPMVAGNVLLEHNLADVIGRTYFPDMGGTATADNQGVLLFEDLWEGHVTLELRQGTLQGKASAEIPQGGGPVEVVVQLQPSGAITGLLKRADGSRVTAGRVDVYMQEGRWFGVSTTRIDQEDGRFRFIGLPTGTATLEAYDPDSRQIGKVTIQVPEHGEAVTEIVCLDKGDVLVDVTHEGTPTQRATVMMRYLGGPANISRAEATTQANGQAAFTLPPGEWSVEVTDPVTLATGSTRFIRSNNQGPIRLAVRLAALRNLHLTVLPPAGRTSPLDNWRVRSDNGRTLMLRADNTVVLPDMMTGRFKLQLFDDLDRPRGGREVALTVEGQDTQYAQLRAMARGTVEATVLDAHGQPAVAMAAAILPKEGSLLPLRTDNAGRVRFTQRLQGEQIVWARDEAAGLMAEGKGILSREDETVSLTLTLNPTATLQGTLRDANGDPVRFNLVTVSGPILNAYATDQEGRFTAENLPLGTYDVRAHIEGRNRAGSRRVTLTRPGEPVDASFTLSSAGTLQGRVTDPLRTDVGGLELHLGDGGGFWAQTSVRSDGSYRFSDVPAGRAMTLTARMDDKLTAAGSWTLQVPSEGTAELNVTLEPRPCLEGRTLRWATDPVDGRLYETHQSMNVVLQDASTGVIQGRTSTNVNYPRYQLNYLVPGVRYRLSGYDGPNLVAQTSMVLNATQERQTHDLYAMPTRTLQIRLRQPDGALFITSGRIDVLSQRPGGGSWTAPLVDGVGEVADVTTGPVVIRISAIPGLPVVASGEIQVLEGTGPLELDVTAPALGSLRVAVKTASGRTLVGTRLVVQAEGSPRWEGVLQADRTYLVTGVWTGRPLGFELTGFGAPFQSPKVTLASPQLLDITLNAPDQAAIAGTVRDAAGTAVANAMIYVDRATQAVAMSDASGQFQLPGLALGTHVLEANVNGRAEYARSSLQLAADGGTVACALTLLGTGTVDVTVRESAGGPLVGQSIELQSAAWGAALRRAETTGTGTVRFDQVVEGPVTARALIRGLRVEARGQLAPGGQLALTLQARPQTRVTGRFRRATLGVDFPRGTVAILRDHVIPVAVDGTLSPDGGALVLGDPDVPAPLQLRLPNTPVIDYGRIDLVPDGETRLELNVPPLAPLEVSVSNKDGWMLEGARIEGPGLLEGRTDGLGIWRGHALLQATPEGNTFDVRASVDGGWGKASATLRDEETVVRVPIRVSEAPEVAAIYGSGELRIVAFQEGTSLWLEASQDSARQVTAQATLQGLTLTGTYTTTTGEQGSLSGSFGSDLQSFQATLRPTSGGASRNWNATRQVGVALKVMPDALTLPAGSVQNFRALVAGTPDKRVTWSSDRGAITSEGAFTAPAEACTALIRAESVAAPGVAAEASAEVRVRGVYITPAPSSMLQGESRTFQALVVGLANTGVTWSASAGVMDPATGRFTAPDAGGPVTLTAVSTTDNTLSGTAVVQVRDLVLHLEPAQAQVPQGGTQAFRVTVEGSLKQEVVWEGAGTEGAVTSDGVYTAPLRAGTYTLRVRSASDPTRRAEAQITVPEVALRVTPATLVLTAGSTAQFTAQVTGTVNKDVVWRADKGTISAGGYYTAPLLSVGVDREQVLLTATSTVDATKSATATLIVEERPQVQITAPERANANATGLTASVAQGTDWRYLWRVEGGTLLSPERDPRIRFDAGQGSTLTLHCHVTNPRGLTAYGSRVIHLENGSIDATLIAPDEALVDTQGLSALVRAIPGATYAWTVEGGTLTSDATRPAITFSATDPGMLRLTCRIQTLAGASAVGTKDVTVVEGLDVSGRFTLNGQGHLVLYQEGRQVEGVWTPATGPARILAARLDGPVMVGTWQEADGSQGRVRLGFTTYGDHFTGTWGTGDQAPGQPWSGDRLAEVVIRVRPESVLLRTGEAHVFRADVGGARQKGTLWSASSGSVDEGGQYLAPGDPGLYRVAATPVADSGKRAEATVNVGRQAAMDVAGTFNGGAGDTLYLEQYGAELLADWNRGKDRTPRIFSGRMDNNVATGTWVSTDGSEGGRFQLTFALDGRSFQGSWTPEGGAAVLWSAQRGEGITLRLRPKGAYVNPGATLSLRASVGGTPLKDVVWTASCGSVDAGGVYTAPNATGTCQVTAASLADPRIKASVTLNLTDQPLTVLPETLSLPQGGTALFQARRGAVEGGVTWTATGGTILPDGRYRAPMQAGVFTLTATSQADGAIQGQAQVTVQEVSLRVVPSSASVDQGATLALRAEVVGTTDPRVAWSVEPAEAGLTNGTVDATGVLAAPQAPTRLRVTATSLGDPRRTAQAEITVPDITVALTPAVATVAQGGSLAFQAKVLGTLDQRVTWRVDGGGTLTDQGVFTAPASGGPFTVTATSVANPGRSATATVTLGNVAVSVSPGAIAMAGNQSRTFTATVTGTVNTAVVWRASAGTITPAGVYTAPRAAAGPVVITATSEADPSRYGQASVTLVEKPDAAISAPDTVETFSVDHVARVQETAGGSYAWTIQGGTLTSPPDRPQVTFTAGDGGTILLGVRVTGLGGVQAFGTRAVLVLNGLMDATITADDDVAQHTRGWLAWVPTQAGATYAWSMTGGTLTSPADQPVVHYAVTEAGQAQLTCTVSRDGARTATATRPVNVVGAPDVSGTLRQNTGYVLLLHQQGARVWGDWQNGNSQVDRRRIEGTLRGRLFTGTWQRLDQPGNGRFEATFSADLATLQGSYGNNEATTGSTLTANRQADTVTVAMEPSLVHLQPQQTQGFRVRVAGLSDKEVAFSATGGTIAPSGQYLSPETPGAFQVAATSVPAPAQRATATVLVNTLGALDVSGVYTESPSWTLVLFQEGTRVFGDRYTGSPSAPTTLWRLEGTLNGTLLTGTWVNTSGTGQGRFRCAFTADASQGSLTWGSGEAESGLGTATETRTAGAVRVRISPAMPILRTQAVQRFQAWVAGCQDKTVGWTTTGGTLTADGILTAPAANGRFTVTARSTAAQDASASTIVSASTDGVLDVSGDYLFNNTPSLQLHQQGSRVFGTYRTSTRAEWQLEGTLQGRLLTGVWAYFTRSSVARGGRFEGTVNEDASSIALQFRSEASTSVSFSGTATRRADAVLLAMEPASAVLAPGEPMAFQALVSGAFDKAVTWSLSGNGGGAQLDQEGRYTAPTQPGTYRIAAASKATPSVSGEGLVVVREGGMAQVSGVYTSTRGELLLQQDGAAITGCSRYDGLLLQGTLDHTRLQGTWSEPGTGRQGRFELRFDAEGQTFFGAWGVDDSASSHGGWQGDRNQGSVLVNIFPSGTLRVRPGAVVAFRSVVAGAASNAVTWACSAGTITPEGRFTAPETLGSYTVTATAATGALALTRVEVVPPVVVTPREVTVIPTATAQFTAALAGFTRNDLTWTTTEGTVSNTGSYKASTRVGPYSAQVRATSVEDPTQFGEATVQVPALQVTVTPSPVTLPVGRTQAFKATVAQHLNNAVTWSCTGGTIDSNGLFTAGTETGTYEVRATSVADPTRAATVVVTLMSADPEAALVAAYRFEEAAGDRVQDASGHGLDGAVLGRPFRVPGRLSGQAMAFTDPISRVEVPHDDRLNLTSATVALWLRLDSYPNTGPDTTERRTLIRKGRMFDEGGFNLELSEDRTLSWREDSGAGTGWNPKGFLPLPVGRWVHIAVTYDQNTGQRQAYLDGVLMDSSTWSVGPLGFNTSPLYINGYDPGLSGGWNHVDGAMDDVRIYSRALTPGEIAALPGPVMITPRRPSLKPGQTVTFAATGTPVSWEATQGAVTDGGVYTAPAQPGVYALTARSVADPSRFDRVDVDVAEYDGARDFALTNPAGPWTYGYKANPAGAFRALDRSQSETNGTLRWTLATSTGLAIRATQEPSGVDGRQVVGGPGRLALLPGSAKEMPTLRWTAPADGAYDIRAHFLAGLNQTRSVAYVLHNNASVFESAVNCYLAGPTFQATRTLRAGDTLDFAVDTRGSSYSTDTTLLDVTLRQVRSTLAITPGQVVLAPGEGCAFRLEPAGVPVVWTLQEGLAGGTLTSEGAYTAPLQPGVYHVVATSTQDASLRATATVRVLGSTLEEGPDIHLTLDEGTGILAQNASDRHPGQGQLAGGPVWSEGRLGGGLDVSAATAKVNLVPAYALPRAWTFTTWIRTPLPVTSTAHVLVASAQGDLQVLVQADQQALGTYQASGGISRFHDSGFRMSALAPGWHHLAAVASGNRTRFFVDGQPVGRDLPWQSMADVSLLGNHSDGSQAWGQMDDVRLYPRALDPVEIAELGRADALVVSPSRVRLQVSQAQTFQASDLPVGEVTWRVLEPGGGQITPEGRYTAPTVPGTFHVEAASRTDATRRAMAVVQVEAAEPVPDLHFPMDEGQGTRISNVGSADMVVGNLGDARDWIQGRTGSGLAVQSSSQRITLVPQVALGGAWTQAAWVRLPLPTADQRHTLFLDDSGNAHVCFGGEDTARLGAWQNTPGTFHDSGASLAGLPAGWHHVAAVGEGGQTRFYVDGQAVGQPIPYQGSTPLAYVGCQPYYNRFVGDLDDVRIYHRALTPDQVRRLGEGALEIVPGQITVAPGATQRFTASQFGQVLSAPTWELPQADSGGIDAEGRYTAPEREGVYPIRVRAADGSLAHAYVTVSRLLGGRWGHWAFDGNASDASGQGHPGRAVGSVAWVPGRQGDALGLDGGGSHLSVSGIPPFNGAFTVATWVRFDALGSSPNPILGYSTSSSSWPFRIAEENRRIRFYLGAGTTELIGSDTLQSGVWIHVACTFDGAVGRIYLDGRLDVADRCGSSLVLFPELLVGRQPSGSLTTSLRGALDDLRIYRRALRADEVAALMTAPWVTP